MFCSCCKRSEIKLGSGNEGGIYYKFADTLSDIDENITNIRTDRKSTRLNSSHPLSSRMPSSA